jgi:hypothetical protein
MRKLKALGLALIAICAIGAVTAAQASATYKIKSASGGTVSGTGVTTTEMQTDVGTVKCTSATFTGEMATETTKELLVSPSYSGCSLAGVKVDITIFNCHFIFSATTPTPPRWHTLWVFLCTPGWSIVIHDTAGLGCEVKLESQEPKGVVQLENEAAGTILASPEVSGIKYSWTAGCPNSGGKAGSNTNGTYKGNIRLSAKNKGGESVGLLVE